MKNLIMLCGVLAGGCVPAGPFLQWDAAAPAYVQPQGRVAIRYVPNRRPEKKGAQDAYQLGNQRSGFGIPYPIRPEGDPPIDQIVSQIVTQSMAASGIGMTQAADPYATAHVSVEIHRLWCDGYYGYKADVALQIVVIDPRNGAERMRIPVEREGSGAFCREAYRRALTDVSHMITQAFLQPQVRMAVVGAPQPPSPAIAPPPPAAPPPAGSM